MLASICSLGHCGPQHTGSLDHLDTEGSEATVPRRWKSLVPASACVFAALALSTGPAHAANGSLVYPGMEVRQGTNLCTVGFVDLGSRTGYTAGHCRGGGTVGDKDGNYIGTETAFRDNTPNGATVDTNHQIADWEAFSVPPEIQVSNVLPSGRQLISDPSVVPSPGLPVCHFGVVTGESCGTVEAVNNGWFTMANGVVSQKGDSGGPVYMVTADGRAAIVGMFNSTWGQYPAAVSWQAASQQAGEDVISAASAPAPATTP